MMHARGGGAQFRQTGVVTNHVVCDRQALLAGRLCRENSLSSEWIVPVAGLQAQ